MRMYLAVTEHNQKKPGVLQFAIARLDARRIY